MLHHPHIIQRHRQRAILFQKSHVCARTLANDHLHMTHIGTTFGRLLHQTMPKEVIPNSGQQQHLGP
jgi:hypothetical protein